ncbi:YHS domain-containing (seleno)protein [Algibacter miyuki]|uniref:YHS domain-containing (Seleno)protein n=1 Tax=Algibacter miyuki TaxID=1306933 RepID=A0ABV5H3L4_9FLAO|nr:YHS domain-containing (seleno)protein [Algibacter miyuki]MDN3665367.1 YHS domain-containing (seleno)protein [Algibacter miyuki]
MKHVFIILFALSTYVMQAQDVDYYTKGGFVVEGFDVVSYFNNAPKEGSEKYVATYKGGSFKFINQKNLEVFNKNPERYIPEYGGYCAYAVAVKSKKVSIDPETYEIRDGKLYLFYNSWGTNTLESWIEESPDNLRKQADNNWETLNKKQ